MPFYRGKEGQGNGSPKCHQGAQEGNKGEYGPTVPQLYHLLHWCDILDGLIQKKKKRTSCGPLKGERILSEKKHHVVPTRVACHLYWGDVITTKNATEK